MFFEVGFWLDHGGRGLGFEAQGTLLKPGPSCSGVLYACVCLSGSAAWGFGSSENTSPLLRKTGSQTSRNLKLAALCLVLNRV